MANSFAVSRAQLIYALCLPLAVLMGYLLADPQDMTSVAMVGLVIGLLSIPAFMRWYHPWLVFSINAVVSFMFLPGQPSLWLLLSCIGFLIALLNRFTNQEAKFIEVRSLNLPLVFLAAVVIATAVFRGGLGLRILGSSQFGGKYYIFLLAGILGYFALTSRRIPPNRAKLYAAIFFLSGLTGLLPRLADHTGMSFLYMFFGAALSERDSPMFLITGISRPSGFTFLFPALYCFVLARGGIRGLLDMKRPWRMAIFLLSILVGLYCGFRGALLLFLFTMAFQFYFEGLCRPRNLAIVGGVLLLVGVALVPNVDRLPFVIQRSLSFLPVQVNPVVEVDAVSSSEWRLRMWRDLMPRLPKYFLLGKGYGFDADEQYMTDAHINFGEDFTGSMLAGDYHNGPLTTIIPFGIWGVVGMIWFCVASLKYLYRNIKQGPPELLSINTFLLALFASRLVQFCFVYGMFPLDLPAFAGIMGLSVSLNGGEQPKPEEEQTESKTAEAELEPELVES